MTAEINYSSSYIDSGSPPKTSQKAVHSKIKWTKEEDELLKNCIQKYGTGNWSLVAQELEGRTGKQCRERWTNQLNPNLKKENWTLAEDHILLQQQKMCGNSWSKIARCLPGRSSNCVKNRWSWLLRHRILPTLGRTQPPPLPILPSLLKPQETEKINFQPEQIDSLPIFILENDPISLDLSIDKMSDQIFDSFDRELAPLWEPGERSLSFI